MDTCTTGTILLVGEGNFSFAVALKQKLPHVDMVATSFEKEPISLLASTNIQVLKNQGVKVCLGVDGTILESNPTVNKIKYSRIIFNFPHAGGKGCIKKNRKLLKDFFCSSSQLLSNDGDICVTLCCGQGGTGEEKYQREWYNHWQIVSMATYGELILKNIWKFQHSNFVGYTSGGYRNQDKGFSTENALIHVFKKGQPIIVSADLCIIGSFQWNDRKLYCIKYYADKLQSCKTWECHPLVQNIKIHLINVLAKHLKLKDLSERNINPYIPSQLAEPNNIPVMEDKICCKEKINENARHLGICQSNLCSICTLNCHREQYVLLQTLKQYLPDLLSQSKNFQDSELILIFKTVYSSAPIHFNSLPFKYQVLGITKLAIVDIRLHIQKFLSNLERSVSSSDSDDIQPNDPLFETIHTCENSTCQNLLIANKHKLTEMQKFSSVVDDNINKLSDDCCEYFEISEVYSQFHSGFLIDLTKLATIRNTLKDWRYLLISPTANASQENSKINTYNAFSLYPPIFNHDLSFWEPQHLDEALFNNTIRSTVGDLIRDVVLLERHYHKAKNCWSRLYRFTYESLDQPLSPTKCSTLQLHLRSVLENVLGLSLR